MNPDTITICGLEVWYRVGVPDSEREQPQRLLLNVEITHDTSAAAASDDLRHTIDYHAVSQRLMRFGEGQRWKLIEKVAADIADLILREFGATRVTVEVQKFVIPQARYVSVRIQRG